MTLGEMILQIEKIRPSQFDKHDLTGWINEVEQRVVDEVCNRAIGFNLKFQPYEYDLDSERMLLIPNPYREVYETYVYAKIDYANAEIDRYNLDATMATAAWQNFAAWFRRRHRPKPVFDLPYGRPGIAGGAMIRQGSYMDLADKPAIEGVTLEGNKTFPELNLRDLTNEEIEALFD